MTPIAMVRERAFAAAKSGDHVRAALLFDQAAQQYPADAALHNSIGNFYATGGQNQEALAWFDRALSVAPDFGEAAINRAVVLTRMGRSREAVLALDTGLKAWRELPRYWTTRGAAEIAADDKAAAAVSYDQALRREPRNARALAGRASVALDRGEDDVVVRHERALAANPGDPYLLLGLTNALDLAGRLPEAVGIAVALARQLPSWLPGMERLAELRAAAHGTERTCDHYAEAPMSTRSIDTYLSWSSMLSGLDRSGEALAAILIGRTQFPDSRALLLAEAASHDAVGEHAAAAAIFDRYRESAADWQIHEARHRLRRGDPAAADVLLAGATAREQDDVIAWSLRGIAWALLGDDRHAWLSLQPGLITECEVPLSPDEQALAIETLDGLHDRAATPVGQSIRAGSQTRGALFDRVEPIISDIAAALCDAVERYRSALPPADAAHPLLRHRDDPWRFAGSWSIRMEGQGHHASHVHPHGIVSSAAYFAVPAAIDDQAGWLEIGRPPSDLNCHLPPIATIRPQVGRVVLFPSTLYHGTRPIRSGKRMTVAFDVGAI